MKICRADLPAYYCECSGERLRDQSSDKGLLEYVIKGHREPHPSQDPGFNQIGDDREGSCQLQAH